MAGKIFAGALVVVALIAGVAMYYLQVYAYYDEVVGNGMDDVTLVSLVTGEPETILYEDFEAIDSDSSPIRYRACFTTQSSIAMLTESYESLARAEPRVAPNWFGCFDAKQIGADLEQGVATAFVGARNVEYGIDRIVAIYPDGRGYAWHEINECGEVVFNGDPVPEGCPAPE